jgi:hypothetical protein
MLQPDEFIDHLPRVVADDWPLKNVERSSGIKRPLGCGITTRTHISSGLASELVGVA